MSQKELEQGKRFWEAGHALVDVSFKTQKATEKHAVAIASKYIAYSIFMCASDKKKIYLQLEKKYPESHVRPLFHAVNLYYAIEPHKTKLVMIHVCADGVNKGLLKYYLQRFFKERYNGIYIYQSLQSYFTKRNAAHNLAFDVANKKIKSSLQLKERHFKRLGII